MFLASSALAERLPRFVLVGPGCTSQFPTRVSVNGPTGIYVRVCASNSGVSVTNTSTELVFWVSITGNYHYQVSPVAPLDPQLAVVAADLSIPSGSRNNAGFSWVDKPGYTLEMSEPPPATVHLFDAPEYTAVASTAAIVTNWAADELSSPPQRLVNEAAACGEDVYDVYSSQDPDDAIREAIRGGFSCYSLQNTINEDLGEQEDAAKDAAAALRRVSRFTKILRDPDLFELDVAEFIERFH